MTTTEKKETIEELFERFLEMSATTMAACAALSDRLDAIEARRNRDES